MWDRREQQVGEVKDPPACGVLHRAVCANPDAHRWCSSPLAPTQYVCEPRVPVRKQHQSLNLKLTTEPLPPAEAARFAELLAKRDQGSESFRAKTQAQTSAAAEIHQPAGEVESRASASTAP